MSKVERTFNLRNKDIKTIEGQTEQQAEIQLQSFLDENYVVIRAMRSHNQVMGKRYNIGLEELDRLEEYIEKESSGRLRWFDGALCQISDFSEVYEHEILSFRREQLSEGIQAVRGFNFWFEFKGSNFECVDLDDGGSRKYFDQKDADGKRKFIKRFAERRRNSAIYIGDPKKLPLGFTAFITDDGEKFVIEDIVSYRDSAPPTRRNRRR